MTGFSTSRKLSKIYLMILVIVLAFSSQACGAPQQPTQTATESQSATAEPTSTPALTAKIQPTKTPIPTVATTPTTTLSKVTISAVEGDIAIRKGPDVTFDAISKLQNGETATVLARSIMDGWVQIEIPSQAGRTGWISVQTNYSIVNGNLLDLPRIDSVEWNVGSYLINCTPHQMIVKPGDVILQPVDDAPNNRVWFSPGLYSVYDLEVEGQPVAANLSVTEHREFHIIKDGTRTQWPCPQSN
ncbi:MAG: SH3 domain-containing protein [Chloroflexi bacterium]|nr:SH3 domain-containing protein [Chloroflexota bacterium]